VKRLALGFLLSSLPALIALEIYICSKQLAGRAGWNVVPWFVAVLLLVALLLRVVHLIGDGFVLLEEQWDANHPRKAAVK
jgi:uncharacterized membrane protein YadS